MKRVLISLLSVVILAMAFLIALPTSAHSGRTDGSGGHYNRSMGEYHYHHGYPPHQHIGGTCVYDFDDQTDHHGGSSSKSASTPTPAPAFTPKPTDKLAQENAHYMPSQSQDSIFTIIIKAVIALFAVAYFGGLFIGILVMFCSEIHEK